MPKYGRFDKGKDVNRAGILAQNDRICRKSAIFQRRIVKSLPLMPTIDHLAKGNGKDSIQMPSI